MPALSATPEHVNHAYQVVGWFVTGFGVAAKVWEHHQRKKGHKEGRGLFPKPKPSRRPDPCADITAKADRIERELARVSNLLDRANQQLDAANDRADEACARERTAIAERVEAQGRADRWQARYERWTATDRDVQARRMEDDAVRDKEEELK